MKQIDKNFWIKFEGDPVGVNTYSKRNDFELYQHGDLNPITGEIIYDPPHSKLN